VTFFEYAALRSMTGDRDSAGFGEFAIRPIENPRQLAVTAFVLGVLHVIHYRYGTLSNMGWLTIRFLPVLIPASPRRHRLTSASQVFT
jgi:hypothetical protein